MKHQASGNQLSSWPRVWGVEDPSLVDLSDEYTAIELFVDDPNAGFYHIFRYIVETNYSGGRVVSEGILLGQSETPDRPRLQVWSGQTEGFIVHSCINLGVERYETATDLSKMSKRSGKINDDPIVFLNFDPQTTTARFVTSLDCVPALVREHHLGYLPEHVRAV